MKREEPKNMRFVKPWSKWTGGLKEMRTVENGIVRSVCFPMKRFRNFVQKGQKLRMVHLVKI